MTQEEFRAAFVEAFSSNSRIDLYQQFVGYAEAFSVEVVPEFTQWIGGSFTTTKRHPQDIDVLTILRRSDYEAHRKLIEHRFERQSALYPLIDAYLIPVSATSSSPNPLFRSDLLYWVHQFGKTVGVEETPGGILNSSTMHSAMSSSYEEEFEGIRDRSIVISDLIEQILLVEEVIVRHRAAGTTGLELEQYVERRKAFEASLNEAVRSPPLCLR